MATGTLSRDKLAFGRAVLLATDSVGLSPEGAFWLWDSETKRWGYFLVTSMFDRIGGRELYLRLDEVLKEKLSEVEVYDFTFFIAGPNEGLINEIRKHITTKGHVSESKTIQFELNGRNTKAVVYRLAVGLGEDSVERTAKLFLRLSGQFAAA